MALEICKNAVTRDEMRQLEKSWWCSVDRDYMSDIGCLFRLVVLGRSLEVYNQVQSTTGDRTD